MMGRAIALGVVVCGLLLVAGTGATAASTGELVGAWMNSSHRAPGNAARNRYRHPKETLTFFGLKPSMTVVEVWPSGGWYLEILAPLLRDDGTYYAAGFALTAKRTPAWRKDVQRTLQEKLAKRPDLYDRVVVTELSIPERTKMAPAGTADMVLTFRNIHNWMKGDYAPGMFAAMFEALKSGGVLGVVEHRAKPGASREQMIESGYVTEAHARKLAKHAGFRFVSASEVNANPKDTADHPAGVWSLPPTLRLGDKDETKYRAIGESDRMTLRFVKPEKKRSKR
jgi:predicted methyltransferase